MRNHIVVRPLFVLAAVAALVLINVKKSDVAQAADLALAVA